MPKRKGRRPWGPFRGAFLLLFQLKRRLSQYTGAHFYTNNYFSVPKYVSISQHICIFCTSKHISLAYLHIFPRIFTNSLSPRTKTKSSTAILKSSRTNIKFTHTNTKINKKTGNSIQIILKILYFSLNIEYFT